LPRCQGRQVITMQRERHGTRQLPMEVERGGLARPVGVELRVLGETLGVEGPATGEGETLRPRARLDAGSEPGDDVALPGLRRVEQIVVPRPRQRQRSLEVEILLRHRRPAQDDPSEKTETRHDPPARTEHPAATPDHAGTTEVQSTSTATLLLNRSTESTRNPLSAFRCSRIPSTPARGPLAMRTRIPSLRHG